MAKRTALFIGKNPSSRAQLFKLVIRERRGPSAAKRSPDAHDVPAAGIIDGRRELYIRKLISSVGTLRHFHVHLVNRFDIVKVSILRELFSSNCPLSLASACVSAPPLEHVGAPTNALLRCDGMSERSRVGCAFMATDEYWRMERILLVASRAPDDSSRASQPNSRLCVKLNLVYIRSK
jgi:hypothetical protein